MFTVSVKSNIAELTKDLQLRRDQIPFAASLALNRTGQNAKVDLVDEMRRVFDRPTPYTLNSVFMKASTKTDLKVVIWLKDEFATSGGTPASKYLAPEVFGGERNLKRFELALIAKGLMPVGMMAVPGGGAKLDSYGNMSRGQIMQILSALGAAERVSGFSANRTMRSIKRAGKRGLPEFFVGKPGGGKGPLGIWQRTAFAAGSAVKPVLVFVRPNQYRVRFKFFDVAQATFDREFDHQFGLAMTYAIATAH